MTLAVPAKALTRSEALACSVLLGLVPAISLMAGFEFDVEWLLRLALIGTLGALAVRARPSWLVPTTVLLVVAMAVTAPSIGSKTFLVTLVGGATALGVAVWAMAFGAVASPFGDRGRAWAARAGTVIVLSPCAATWATKPWPMLNAPVLLAVISALGVVAAIFVWALGGTAAGLVTPPAFVWRGAGRVVTGAGRSAASLWAWFAAVTVRPALPPDSLEPGGRLRRSIAATAAASTAAVYIVAVSYSPYGLFAAPVGIALGHRAWRRVQPKSESPARPGVLFPVTMWLCVALAVNLFGYGDGLLSVGSKQSWDYWIYAKVATVGYGTREGFEAVFPMLPLMMRGLSRLGVPLANAAVGVSTAAGLVSTLLFWWWLGLRRVPAPSRHLALAVFLLYPYAAITYGGGYPDSLLVMFCLGAFVLAERNQLLGAGLVGALATFTRPNALPIIPALLLLGLVRDGVLVFPAPTDGPIGLFGYRWLVDAIRRVRIRRDRFRRRHLLPLLSLAGIGAYSVWMLHVTGDPLYFWTVQGDYYGHAPITNVGSWIKYGYLTAPGDWFSGPYQGVLDNIGTTLCVVTAIGLIPTLARRFGLAYGLLALGLLAVFIGGGDSWLTPGARLLLPAFPLAAIVGEWLAPRRQLWLPTLGTLAAWLLFVAHGFSSGKCCW